MCGTCREASKPPKFSSYSSLHLSLRNRLIKNNQEVANMSKFNTKTESTATQNLAGGKAFSMKPEQELVHAVLTTFLEDKYYESGSDRITRIQSLIRQNKPQFTANLAVIARKEFNLRSVTHVLLGELSKSMNIVSTPATPDGLVKDAIVAAAVRPDDVLELAAYVGKPMPKQVKRGIRNAILKWDRYQLAKYRGEGKDISMVDLFNLTHPKAQHATIEQQDAWSDLMNGKLVSFDTWETEISNAKNDKERTKIWENLILEDKIGYMALLRNLNNLIKYNVSKKARLAAMAKLTNPEEVKKSRQLPFRFITAYENVTGDREFSDAISIAMDHAVANTPELSGKTLIAVDTSGSMSGDPIKKASIFAATLAKANINADVILYDTTVKELTINSRIPVIDIAQKIQSEAMGGGTETSLTFHYAIMKKKLYDRFIIISDNESWAEGYGRSVQSAYAAYKKTTGTDPFIYAVDIQGYGTKDVAGTRVCHMTGWSDRLLDFIGQAEKGETLVEYIRNYQIPKRENEIKKSTKSKPKISKNKNSTARKGRGASRTRNSRK